MEFLQELGYLGVFLGAFLAATVVPFSSEIIVTGILMTGASPMLVFIYATLGNWLGGVTSYTLGYLGKWKWIERWFRIKRESLERQRQRIDKFGAYLALLSWLPIVGDIFAIGLGFYKLNAFKCIFFMLIGKAARFAIWIYLYVRFGEEFLNIF